MLWRRKVEEETERRFVRLEKSVEDHDDRLRELTKISADNSRALSRLEEAIDAVKALAKELGDFPSAWRRFVVVWDVIGWWKDNAIKVFALLGALYVLTSPSGLRAIIEAVAVALKP